MAATIKDVARLANCSIKTVSRVINHEAHVADETRSRVLAAIRASGYMPNLAARSLVLKKSFAICVLLYPGFVQPASVSLNRLLEITYEQNYDLFMQTYYPTFPQSRRRIADLATSGRFDGFISTPPCEADGFLEQLFETYRIPLVQMNPLQPEVGERQPRWTVSADDLAGSRLAVEHLLSLGHRRIACFRGPRNLRASADRLGGCQQALARAGLSLAEDYLQDSEYTFDGGYTATQLLMRLPQPPTAIYAGSDEAAQGALFAAQELGIPVPGVLSICGHDDFLASARIWPGLTTVHQPIEDLLEQAMQMLIGILKGAEPPAAQVILPPRLVVRGSTGLPGG